jgi:hypothetical protein
MNGRKRGAQVQPVEPRFQLFVRKMPNGCWLWSGHRMRNGYATISVEGYPRLAHRVSWELHRGPIPEGMHVLHACDVNCPPGDVAYRACVNPDHLFLGTNLENHRDSVAKGREASGERSHAVKGTACHSAKLTERDVRDIRRHAAGGATYGALGRQYGVSNVAIRKLVLRKSWRHVE